jgi:hypothetical protein
MSSGDIGDRDCCEHHGPQYGIMGPRDHDGAVLCNVSECPFEREDAHSKSACKNAATTSERGHQAVDLNPRCQPSIHGVWNRKQHMFLLPEAGAQFEE